MQQQQQQRERRAVFLSYSCGHLPTHAGDFQPRLLRVAATRKSPDGAAPSSMRELLRPIAVLQNSSVELYSCRVVSVSRKVEAVINAVTLLNTTKEPAAVDVRPAGRPPGDLRGHTCTQKYTEEDLLNRNVSQGKSGRK
ncbi:hypothetical protein Vretifemale_9459 [Volvox reticuliferus]|uniref:Uncharacterized protein n=1 Tax=Volvox reticuliferus TaxID=1737510 RepID=A0A8J4CHH0_9CHLO|nr:hypothetical protein Vretifemale_9459 [Volvox reticuliferus]